MTTETLQDNKSQMEENRRFQILALDGGGIKGLFSVQILAFFEKDHNVNIADHFDLIAGTSTGGLIALGLASGMTAKDIANFYVTEGPNIFPSSPRRWMQHWFYRKYSQGPLEKALKDVFGEHRTISDLTKQIIVPSYDLGRGKVRIFKTPHHPRLARDGRVKLWCVGLATTAAPTYFPATRCVDGARLIDGGIWANNPAMIAALEAKSMLGASLSNIYILSIGTTRETKKRPNYLDAGGKLRWAVQAADVIMEAQSSSVLGQLRHLLPETNVTRIDAVAPAQLFRLDNVNAQDLTGWASSESREAGPRAKPFFDHIAEPFKALEG